MLICRFFVTNLIPIAEPLSANENLVPPPKKNHSDRTTKTTQKTQLTPIDTQILYPMITWDLRENGKSSAIQISTPLEKKNTTYVSEKWSFEEN